MNYDEQRKYALKLFKNDKYKELRKAIKDGECFEELMPIAEKAGAIEHWDKLLDEWIYLAGRDWEGITNDMRREAFGKLREDKWIYNAGYWKGITDGMRREAFEKLEDEELIYNAGYWEGITDGMRREAFEKLEDEEWIYYAGHYWKGITDGMRREAFKKMEEDEWIYKAGYWEGITDGMRREAFEKLRGGGKMWIYRAERWIYRAERRWGIKEGQNDTT